MQYLILGLVALALVLALVQVFVRANPAVLARHIRLLGGAVLLGIAALLLARGLAGPATLLGLVGAGLMGWSGRPPWSPDLDHDFDPVSSGKTSRVVTDHLEVEMDLESGAVSGRVRKGMFEGRDLDSLRAADVALLWQDCRLVDAESATLLEAYLDRIHPTWRDDVARGEREMRDREGRMEPKQAYAILGLQDGATEDDIRRAHRELMLKLHPDRGGSTYLSAQVNEAKDVLLELL